MFSLSVVCLLCLLVHSKIEVSANKCDDLEDDDATFQTLKDCLRHTSTLFPRCKNKNTCCDSERAEIYLNHIMELMIELKIDRSAKLSDFECPTCTKQSQRGRRFRRSPKVEVLSDLPNDCYDVYLEQDQRSGVYEIYPGQSTQAVSVYCDMDTDGGGWTVIQRKGASVPQSEFYRGWKHHQKGFGNLEKDFWLGNDIIHALTQQGLYTLRIDVKNKAGQYGSSQHRNFSIEPNNYILHMSNFTGNVTDELDFNSNTIFTTKERTNLNGISTPGDERDKMSNSWYEWGGYNKGLDFSEMKIRPAHKIPPAEELRSRTRFL